MILITGTTGLLGSHLLAKLLLNEGTAIKALYRNEAKLDAVKKVLFYYHKDVESVFDRVEWIKGDINNVNDIESALVGVKQVYHCAAFVSFDPKKEKAMLKVNVEGTANMVNLSIDHKVEKFLHVSSIATLGKSIDASRINEEDYWNPNLYNSSYAISKNGGEMEVWRAMEEGLKAVIVNPSVIIGPGFWKGGTGSFITQVDKGLKFYPQGGTGFVGVEDVAEVMIQLMESEISAERFIVNSQNLSFRELFNLIAESLEKSKPFIKIPNFVIGLAWRLDAFFSLIFGKKRTLTKDSAKSASKHNQYDNSKVVKSLDYEFATMDKVISSTVEKYKKETN